MEPFTIVGGLMAAGAGFLGQRSANKQNVKLARERMQFEDAQAQRQMDFQERMSSTAAQRSVADFKEAGLNPALAYGTTAATPSGASGSGAQATVSDAVDAGMSSAKSALALKQAMQLAREQHVADLRLKEATALKTLTEGATQEELGRLHRAQYVNIGQQTLFNSQLQPANLRRAISEAVLSELMQPTARGEAEFSQRLGAWRPALGSILTGARAAGEFTRLIPRVGR